MKEKLKPLQLIHIALCSGVLLAYFVLGDLLSLNFVTFPKLEGSSFVYLIIPLSAIFLGNMLFKSQLKNVDKKLKLEEKIGPYQTASILRLAILEGAAFLILFLKKEFLLIGLFLIGYMAFLRPSEERMKGDFGALKR